MWKTDTLSEAFTVSVQGEKCCHSSLHLIVLSEGGDALSLHRLQLSSRAHSELRST